MNRLSIYTLAISFVAVLFSGCIKNNFDQPDNNGCIDEGLQRNITISDLKAFFSGTAVKIDQDLIIEGVVVSDDADGNFYKSLVIQDETGGILVYIDQTNLYTSFPQGRKVYVKAKDLVIDDYGGLIQLGGSIDSTTGDLVRIPQSLVNTIVFKGPCQQSVDTLEVPINQLDGDLQQSRLVKLVGVTMDNNDAGLPYANVNGSSSTNRTVVDCNNTPIILRTSDFVSFAGTTTPTERFNLTGVLSVFNGDLQIAIRNLKDIEVTGGDCPCIEVTGSNPGTTSFELDNVNIVDGSQATLLDEDFSSTTSGSAIGLSGWKNIAQAGTQMWEGDSYNTEKYARASAYQTGESNVVIWLITPAITVTGDAETLSFQTKDAYDDGAILEVLISTDYDGGNSPQNFTWTKVCPDISGGNTNGFAPSWIPSGDIDLSSFTGTTYIAFRYKGGD